jgi:hypothetical protein
LVVATVIAVAELYRRFGPHPHLGRRSVELTHEVVDPWAEAIADELLPSHRGDELAADTALVGVFVGDRIWRRRHRPE